MTKEMSNDQCPNSKEAPILMLQSLGRDGCLGFGIWELLGAWSLGIGNFGRSISPELGIWDLVFRSLAPRLSPIAYRVKPLTTDN
jgi:hypothetical protein